VKKSDAPDASSTGTRFVTIAAGISTARAKKSGQLKSLEYNPQVDSCGSDLSKPASKKIQATPNGTCGNASAPGTVSAFSSILENRAHCVSLLGKLYYCLYRYGSD
jgi:hypothetical protein